ncbi:hypothetical protein IB244_31225 [Rhizobium sp. RHZ02]|uniref:glycoside hydrolase family 19 protein n=1 Tax=Rhizobium sp. RHZ02 TaxID=2769306 RepID=UPI00178000A4|nr:glycoside hydrolase family 19 protein [Rhizobium sp. RHZ02]MBD9455944.1 hypothetical protein [Rhizobium sp. RHZ02]
MDRAIFFAALRRRASGVFGTSLSQSQVDGINGILDAFATHGDGRDKTLAYALATAYHETGARMVPVREGFAKDDASARRIVAKREYGKPAGKYGHVYYGRGQVQLTWLKNYDTSSADAAYDLVAYPDKMLDPVISARVMIKGLLDGRWNGAGKGIAAYLPTNGPDDLKNARRTVNVTDKWELIGGYYTAFLSAIKEAGGVPVVTPAPQPASAATPKPVVIEPQQVSEGNWLAKLIEAIANVFTRK